MDFLRLDLFSQPFNFYFSNNQIKKGSIFGAFISVGILSAAVAYFAYLTMQFIDNKFDPTFRSQTFVTDGQTQISFQEDLMAFRFEYDHNLSIDEYQEKLNKTFLVTLAYYVDFNHDAYHPTQLDIIQCSNPQLYGFNCIDFSKISDKKLLLNNKEDIFSQIQLLVYDCHATDYLKTTIPSNCADKQDIVKLVNGDYAGLNLRLYTSQYNITSKQNQVNFRKAFIYSESDQFVFITQNIQNQVTKVQQGFVFQSQNEYQGPIQYNQLYQIFNNQNYQPYIEVNLQMDELVSEIQIQFPSFAQVLILVNNLIVWMVTLGYLFKLYSRKLILKDMFYIFLQSMYQDTYEQNLKKNKIFNLSDECKDTEINNEFLIEQQMNCQQKKKKNIQIPLFITKSKQYVEQSQQNEQVDFQEKSKFSKELTNIKSTQSCEILRTQQPNFNFQQGKKKNLKERKKIKLNYNIRSPCANQDKQTSSSLEFQSHQSTLRNKCETKQSAFIPKFNKIQYLKSNCKNVEYYASKIKAIQDKKILNDAKSLIFQKKRTRLLQLFDLRRLCKKKEIDEDYYIQQQKMAKKGIEKQVQKSMQILELYKDLIFIKKSIMVLLKKDQIAALQLVGYSQDNLIQQGNNMHKAQNEYNQQVQKNFFEQRFELLNSQELQSEYIKKFIKKCQSGQNLDKVDQRIFSSIL
ncbi:AMP-binding enzyme family protein (macronuclear) [Tetrahymena thermophila SB210]|uniref:AMP-binding enzyme family protein n=1 Tax=Tetrahymena thermophila (strain SB210) TaxID=312017 RepID=Q22PG4_TETTS|nr:AMP-binding enzyme family protein [Tetrahymena thermophila SB210]EAR87145.2 AMP-binding enzyme family protein [Tetrahymena thermophila SB210]|eukprot:XP_001007390.2 AMP-binding enzyme family protein [Tetrahymena thermophila SB210]